VEAMIPSLPAFVGRRSIHKAKQNQTNERVKYYECDVISCGFNLISNSHHVRAQEMFLGPS